MQKIPCIETAKQTGQTVTLAGWVHSRRDHGKLIFIDLRDRSGLVQLVFSIDKIPDAQKLRAEFVIQIKGRVKERPKGMDNPKITTGKVEVEVEELEILAQAKTPPFELTKDTKSIDEELRMKYRYLDLRTERMRSNLELRYQVVKFIRDWLDKQGFWEIETPNLTKSTPEGARDYLVPSRLHSGKFYALPQSPQQYKQLLMVAGVEKYFQIARCFRDEDPRGDRQPEHTQLDLEMSFPSQDDILKTIEDLYTALIKALLPKKTISQSPWPRLKFDDCMAKYKTDRPDLRKDPKNLDELAFCWVIDWPMFEWNKDEKRWDPYHHIFTSPRKEDLPLLEKDPAKVRSWQHDLVLNGQEVAGGSIRITDPKVQTKVLELVGIDQKEIQERFGHMLKAFEYGVPPHGGIASGIDRLVAILANENSIREVIAFPKTGDGRDLMMDAPSEVDAKQLKETHLKIVE